MSDKKEDAEQLQILTLPHYAELLFGHGKRGWQQDWSGNYFRSVEAMPGMKFTRDDFQSCCQLLKDKFGIDVVDAEYKKDGMTFWINGQHMQVLLKNGMGQEHAGRLFGDIRSAHSAESISQLNDPLVALEENIRLAVHDSHAWHDTLMNRLYTDNQRECDIVLPELFLQKLEQVLPPHSGDNVALIHCVTTMLEQLLPEVPVAVKVQPGRRANMTIAVKEADYEKLDAVLAGAKKPSNNITSIMRKIEERDAGIKR